MTKLRSHRVMSRLVLPCMFLTLGVVLSAKSDTFNSSAVGDWSNAANWTPMGVPGPGDIADLENNSTAVAGPAMNLTGDTTVSQFFLGDANPAGNAGRLDLNGFVFTATQSIAIGRFGGLGFIDGRSDLGKHHHAKSFRHFRSQ